MTEFRPVNQYSPLLLDCSLRCFVSAVMTGFRPVNQYALLEITMARVIATTMINTTSTRMINTTSMINRCHTEVASHIFLCLLQDGERLYKEEQKSVYIDSFP
jgi:hypothetical protein